MIGEVVFSLLVFFSIIIDLRNPQTKTCIKNNPKVLPSLILHHLFSIFAYFGWMISNKTILQIYLLVPPLLYIHWKTYGYCYWTVLTNRQCGWDKGKNLNDLLEYFNLKDTSFLDTIPYYLLIIFTGYLIGIFRFMDLKVYK